MEVLYRFATKTSTFGSKHIDTPIGGWMERAQIAKSIWRWLDTRLQDFIQATSNFKSSYIKSQDQKEL